MAATWQNICSTLQHTNFFKNVWSICFLQVNEVYALYNCLSLLPLSISSEAVWSWSSSHETPVALSLGKILKRSSKPYPVAVVQEGVKEIVERKLVLLESLAGAYWSPTRTHNSPHFRINGHEWCIETLIDLACSARLGLNVKLQILQMSRRCCKKKISVSRHRRGCDTIAKNVQLESKLNATTLKVVVLSLTLQQE